MYDRRGNDVRNTTDELVSRNIINTLDPSMNRESTNDTGVVTLSIEIELGWSLYRSGKLHNLSTNRRDETNALSHLLSLCDQHEIPISFDIVGHLMLSECNGDHPDGRFDLDPGGDVSTDPEFYAPDLVRSILDADVDHELATHTFSHVLLDEVSSEVVTWELDASRELHQEYGAQFVSLVTPRHRRCDPVIARNAGIEIVRMPADTHTGITPNKSRLKQLYSIFSTPPVIDPIMESGMVYTFSSRYPSLAAPFLPSGHDTLPWMFSVLPLSIRERLHRRRLVRTATNAAQSGSFTHLWCHLFDLSPDCQRRPLDEFFRLLDQYRERGLLSIKTMSELNDYVRDRQARH